MRRLKAYFLSFMDPFSFDFENPSICLFLARVVRLKRLMAPFTLEKCGDQRESISPNPLWFHRINVDTRACFNELPTGTLLWTVQNLPDLEKKKKKKDSLKLFWFIWIPSKLRANLPIAQQSQPGWDPETRQHCRPVATKCFKQQKKTTGYI